STEGSYSLQPRFAQGGKHALQYRWIFEGGRLPPNLQRVLGIEPQDFCCLRPCLLLPAQLAVADSQAKVGRQKIGIADEGFLVSSPRLLSPPQITVGLA